MLTVIQGDSLAELRKLPAESVHCCVTSPPYWGLRYYGIPLSYWPDGSRCCFGLEPSPELYVAHSVLIFREVRRVLRKDGTLWLNLGDSYTGAGSARLPGGKCFGKQNPVIDSGAFPVLQMNRMPISGRKPGDLVGIPWLVAFALQADGWFLRRDNIWHKPNPMPESVSGWRWERCRAKTKSGGRHPASQSGINGQAAQSMGLHRAGREHPEEHMAQYQNCPSCPKCAKTGGYVLRKGAWRCTTSHEYVFQFSKSAHYFCDGEAAKERTTGGAHDRGDGVNPKAKLPGAASRVHVDRDVAHAGRSKQNCSFSAAVTSTVSNRNKRSVWTVATAPYAEAHFATFPPALIRPIILAATPPKCCAACGAPYAPVLERGEPNTQQQRACGGDENGEYHGKATKDYAAAGAEDPSAVKARILAGMVERRVIDHWPTCQCETASAPATVLDPFGGSGTTGKVALELGRAAILIELNPDYVRLMNQRTTTTPGLGL